MTHGEPSVSWNFKKWINFDDHDKKGLAKHLMTLDKAKRFEYIKYLETWCLAPGDSLRDYVVKMDKADE